MATKAPSLQEQLESTKILLARFLTSLSSNTTSEQTTPSDPLAILKDAASLLKAHTTKVGLLLLNKPFTPSAVVKILSEMSGTCIPGMMGAIEILGASCGVTVAREVRVAVRQVVSAVQELCKDIESVSVAPEKQQALKTQADSTLASTGQVWSACDAVIALAGLGPIGIICRKAEEHRKLLIDAIEELKEVVAEEDEGYEDDEVSDHDSDILFGPSKISDPDLKAQIGASVKKLGLLQVGIKAISKRRLSVFPFRFLENGRRPPVERLDEVMGCIGQVPDEADELAGKIYEGDSQGAQKQLSRCCETLLRAAEAVRDGWEGSVGSELDEKPFSEWVEKWKGLLQQ